MKKYCVFFVVISVLVADCIVKNGDLDGVTKATPKLPESADTTQFTEENTLAMLQASSDVEVDVLSQRDDDSPMTKAASDDTYIEGYTNKRSYIPGETVHFHVSTTSPNVHNTDPTGRGVEIC